MNHRAHREHGENQNDLSGKIIGCAIRVHKELGPGLLETAYRACLAHELTLNDVKVEVEKSLPIRYRDFALDAGYRIDLLVENRIILELKCVEKLLPVHEAQLLTYLKLSGLHIGLLINFNVKLLAHGIRRFIL